MNNSSMTRKLLTAVVALAILIAGVSIGSRLAGWLSQKEAAGPMIAVIQFEVDRQRHESSVEAISRRWQETELKLAAVQLQAETEQQKRQSVEPNVTPKPQPEEMRRHSDAIQWAEKYRQQRGAAEQEAVSHQGQEEMRRLAQAQIGQQVPWQKTEERKLADGGSTPAKGPLTEKRADQGRRLVKSRVAQCIKSCRTNTKGRVAYQPRGRFGRADADRARISICPLRWLRTVLVEWAAPVLEQRRDRRHYRRVAVG